MSEKKPCDICGITDGHYVCPEAPVVYENNFLRSRNRKLVEKIQEAINLMGGPVMDYSVSTANQERKKYIERGVMILIKALEEAKDCGEGKEGK